MEKKKPHYIDRNWCSRSSSSSTAVLAAPPPPLHQPIALAVPESHLAQRPIQALVATGGRSPVMAVACAWVHVRVYELKRRRVMSVLPEEDVRALALVLDAERETHELRAKTRLNPGVSRGWGSKQLRLVTGNARIRVWTLPYKYVDPCFCVWGGGGLIFFFDGIGNGWLRSK